MKITPSVAKNKYFDKIKVPLSHSHKGQNGKLLLIGGSHLFHAASKWSLDVASKFVDMVFYCSVPENNDLIREAKSNFWNGIVVSTKDVESYIIEADCILIGPGMTRDNKTKKQVDYLVDKYKHKKWVIDAGALQVIDPVLLNNHHIITPHVKEFTKLKRKFKEVNLNFDELRSLVLLKGRIDVISFFKLGANKKTLIKIEGGNAGMTKGGTGDSLAGLVAALYASHDMVTSAVVGSYINKKSGEKLYKTVGPYFNTSDLVSTIPEVFWTEISG